MVGDVAAFLTQRPLVDILITILTGGIGAALLTAFANRLSKKREQYLDIAKYKIDTISKAKPYLIQQARYCDLLFSHLSTNKDRSDIDAKLCLYYISNFLFHRSEIHRQFGEVQFDHLEAERIVRNYENMIIGVI